MLARPITARLADEIFLPATNIATRIEAMLVEAMHGSVTPRGLEDLQLIQRNARRLIHLVDALRFAAGQGPLGWQHVRLNGIVTRAARMLGVAPAALVLDPSDPGVLGHAEALERLLEHLLTHANGFVPSDGVGIVTRRRGNEWVELTISGVPQGFTLPAASRAVLEDHAASAEVRRGPDDTRCVLCFPVFTLRAPRARPEGDEHDV